jgi:4-amino-4-deoxy-L-arabinose transferase-like glycosyltransferase
VIFRALGHDLAAIAALNVVIDTLCIPLVMILARRWFSSLAAIFSGAIYAVWPSQIEFTSVLASELLFNLFLLLSLWTAAVSPSRSWVLKRTFAGLCLAAASYVRPTTLPLVLPLAAALLWRREIPSQVLRFSVVVIVVMAICIAPWTLRNVRELGAPILISSNGAANMWMGNYPKSTGAYMALPAEVAGTSEVDRSKVLGQRAKQFVLHHPRRASTLFLRKIIITHDRETIGISWNETFLVRTTGSRGVLIAKAASTAYWWLALILSLYLARSSFFCDVGWARCCTRRFWVGDILRSFTLRR